ncbi:MAG: hypothetical protein U5S82_16665 [Gammaproteobacteria bacterium]|nr:hypothetical protein [Gammaproteobacteria bacterium]
MGKLAVGIGSAAVGLVSALFGIFREILTSAELETDHKSRLHDSDLMGEYNHRTGRLDAGVDPYGWYDED